MANAPETPQIDVMVGDVSVVVTGGEDDTLDDVARVFDEKFEDAVETYLENRDDGAMY